MDAPVCSTCGMTKARGTTTIGSHVSVFYACPALPHVHEEIAAMVEDENEIDWEDV